MPEFNFAEGQNKKLEQDRETGDIPVPGLSSNDAESSQPAEASSTKKPGSPKQPSVLDSYPERDLSHLTSGQPEAPAVSNAADESSANTATSSSDPSSPSESASHPDAADAPDHVSDSAAADGLAGGNDGSGTSSGGNSGNPARPKPSGNWPLLVFLGVFIFFCALAAIWYLDPWPPLKEAVLGWFDDEAVVAAEQQELPMEEMEDFPQEIPMRSWDFFVQVSSWKDLRKAEKDAEHYRARDFDVAVESEFLKARRSTFYRVRIGPFDSREDATTFTRDYAGMLPTGVFIDSVRIEDEHEVQAIPPPVTRSTRGSGDRADKTEAVDEFSAITGPLTGYAVKVSSFKNADVARGEAKRLLEQGFPSFLTKKQIGGATWYRVLVGPFEDKADSDKYMRLINVAFGNDAYTINLALE